MVDLRSKFGNPWMPDEWNLTTQGQFVKLYGEGRARVFAKVAGTTIGALKPRPMPLGNRTFILTKRLITTDSVGGIIGAGSSGEGPPDEG